jgi:hypothetical protein
MNKSTSIKAPRARGAALLIFVIFFLITSFTLVLSIGHGVYDDLIAYRVLNAGKQSFYGAEAGIEDAVYRHRRSKSYSNTETFTIDSATVTMTRTLVTDYYHILAESDSNHAIRRSKLVLAVGDGASFNFGLQSGTGGILMSNNSSVRGNVYSNGTVEGAGTATVFGDVISAGSSGRMESLHATGSAWAHNLDDATIDKNAYYFATSTRTATIVGGISYPGTTDQATATLPIPDTQVADWEADITTTGTLIASTSPQCAGGTYIITSDTVLGNVKIDCNLEIKKTGASTEVTLTGPVWVSGNLTFSSGPTIIASSSLGLRSVQFIVDKISDRLTSSKVSVNQSTTFSSGNGASYILILSMNNSAETGGVETAINLAQSASGQVLVYAGHGLIDMGNSISLKEVTAFKINISNGAQVIYESGLMSLLFTGGPGGGYIISSWQETP